MFFDGVHEIGCKCGSIRCMITSKFHLEGIALELEMWLPVLGHPHCDLGKRNILNGK